MTPTQNPVALGACLSRGAWKAGTPDSEGGPPQQCGGPTRRFHHGTSCSTCARAASRR
jgi:hypothetical protein